MSASSTRRSKIATVYAVLSLLAVTSTSAQINYLSPDEISVSTPVWSQFTGGVGAGNGVFISPPGDLAVVVSSDASVRAFDPLLGTIKWSASPPDTSSTSTSGAFFSYEGASPYIIYALVSGGSTSVVALNPTTGENVLTTGAVVGVAAGTPVTTSDGKFILLNYNVDGANGFFSVFDIASPATPIFTFNDPAFTAPYGAIGYFWNPGAGYYSGGENNNNDIFIWSLATNQVNNATVGIGQVFAFQMPLIPTAALNVTLVSGSRPFQSPNPPIISNNGFSMYWAVSRSQQYAWVGTKGLGRLDFDTNGIQNVGFERGEPRSAAALAPPTLSKNATGAFVVGPTASNQLFRLASDFSDSRSPLTIVTAAVVSSRVLISPDDLFVYYATPSPDGKLYQINSSTLVEQWNITLDNGISGDIAQTKDGAIIIVADIVGMVQAYKVADVTGSATLAPAAPASNGTGATAPAPATNGTGATAPAPAANGTGTPAPGASPNATISPAPSSSDQPSSGPSTTPTPTATPVPTAVGAPNDTTTGGGSPTADGAAPAASSPTTASSPTAASSPAASAPAGAPGSGPASAPQASPAAAPSATTTSSAAAWGRLLSAMLLGAVTTVVAVI